jgi:hypothetical protein
MEVFNSFIFKTKNNLMEIVKLQFPIIFMIVIVLPVIIINPVSILFSLPYVILLSLLAIAIYMIGLYNTVAWKLWVIEIMSQLKNKVIIRKVETSKI